MIPASRLPIDDGEVVTAAGVSAGIDMALHLVNRWTRIGPATVGEESSTIRLHRFSDYATVGALATIRERGMDCRGPSAY